MSDTRGTSESNDDRTVLFVRLLSENERRLKGYVLSLVPNWADAEEIFADTNARLWEQFDNYESGSDFGAWACTIAHYLVMAYRKRQQRDKQRFSDTFVEAVAEAATEAAADRDDRFRFLAECLETLRAKTRELVRAFYSGRETVEEIAARTGGTSASVYKAVARGRHSLHECIEERLHKEANS
ncbi:MAG: sigma-70 family RNA polymerase sigma factor [Pirellulales bacterium]|nr:sigma-70 family RNA polymerase sigma factor [Pirellulales bacterium]